MIKTVKYLPVSNEIKYDAQHRQKIQGGPKTKPLSIIIIKSY